MKPDSDPKQDTASTQPATQPKELTVSRIILAIVFISACAVAGVDYQAKAKWQTGVDAANKLFDEDNNSPKEYMNKIGFAPRVDRSTGEIIQIYRWTGGLRIYDLRISFRGGNGAYVINELIPLTQITLQAADLSKMELAKGTGTLDDKSTEERFAMTTPTDGDEGPDGSGGPGGSGGGSFQSFNDSDLKMNEPTQAKWDHALKQLNKVMSELPENRREAFTKIRELQQKFRDDTKGFLTAEQYTTFEKNNPVRQSRGRGGISADQLGLEGGAKAKYESATTKLSEEMRAMFTGGAGGSREELREKMTAMRDKFESELKTILDEDQLKKYQELRNQQRQRRGGFRGPGGDGTQSPSPKGNNSKAAKTSPKGN